MINRIRDYVSVLLIGFAYLYGILSPNHYTPSSHDFYINCMVFILCSIGLSIFFFKREIQVYTSDFFWLVIFFILLIQPFFHNILYIDGLIFPLVLVFFSFLFSLYSKNNKVFFREKIIYFFALFFVLGSLLLYLTQLAHVFKLKNIVDIFGIPLQVQRYSGNLYQPNQTAFVYVIGIISSIFFSIQYKKINWLNCIYIFLISSGVTLTSSRAGFIMLAVIIVIYCTNRYKNSQVGISLSYIGSMIFGVAAGGYVYALYTVDEKILGRALKSLEDPRISLFKQSMYIIKDNAFSGVGWKNFASTNIKYYNSIEWVSLTDHTHSIFTHLLVEFGLVFGGGILLYFAWILFKNFKRLNDPINFYVFLILLVFIIYSSLEFPLWDFRYLFVFAIFFGFYTCIDKPLFTINGGISISIIISIFTIFSIYYLIEYRKIAAVDAAVSDPDLSIREKTLLVSQINNVIGLSYFKDQLIFRTITPDGFMLKESIELGNRVTNYTPAQGFLIKQGTLLALDSKPEKALQYFELACKYDWREKCDYTKKNVYELYQKNPIYFQSIYRKMKDY